MIWISIIDVHALNCCKLTIVGLVSLVWCSLIISPGLCGRLGHIGLFLIEIIVLGSWMVGWYFLIFIGLTHHGFLLCERHRYVCLLLSETFGFYLWERLKDSCLVTSKRPFNRYSHQIVSSVGDIALSRFFLHERLIDLTLVVGKHKRIPPDILVLIEDFLVVIFGLAIKLRRRQRSTNSFLHVNSIEVLTGYFLDMMSGNKFLVGRNEGSFFLPNGRITMFSASDSVRCLISCVMCEDYSF